MRSSSVKAIVAWCAGAGVLCLALRSSAGDWPQWRGPLRSGHTAEVDLPITWRGKPQTNVLWKVAADFGHPSPIIWGDRLFLTASVRRSPKDPYEKAASHQHRVACYRTTDGAKLWQTDIEPGSLT